MHVITVGRQAEREAASQEVCLPVWLWFVCLWESCNLLVPAV